MAPSRGKEAGFGGGKRDYHWGGKELREGNVIRIHERKTEKATHSGGTAGKMIKGMFLKGTKEKRVDN